MLHEHTNVHINLSAHLVNYCTEHLIPCREVFKARDRKTNRLVALKKVRMENEKEGVSLHTLAFFPSDLLTSHSSP